MELRNIIAIALVLLGSLVCVANWWSLIQSRQRKRFYSSVPFIGAALLGAGLAMIPSTRPYTWVAVFLDYGTVAFLLSSPTLIREMWGVSRINLLHDYVGKTESKLVQLRLFRNSIFTIRISILRKPGESGLTGTGNSGSWHYDSAQLTLSTDDESANFQVIRESSLEALRQTAGFATWEANPDLSLKHIELIQTGSSEPLPKHPGTKPSDR